MGGFGSGRQPKDLGTGPESRKILADLLADIDELKGLLANEGMVVFGARGAQLIHPAVRALREAQLLACRIEARLPPAPVDEDDALSEFIDQN